MNKNDNLIINHLRDINKGGNNCSESENKNIYNFNRIKCDFYERRNLRLIFHNFEQ